MRVMQIRRSAPRIIRIGEGIEVVIISAAEGRVTLGVHAPAGVPIRLERDPAHQDEDIVDDAPSASEDEADAD